MLDVQIYTLGIKLLYVIVTSYRLSNIPMGHAIKISSYQVKCLMHDRKSAELLNNERKH